ncbi:MAG: glycosyltransferase family 39 protein [Prevotellaceae bacterium]|jgi:hypothetical protein|nr:glycosyltransferase family 39 protein [Prevotellaceae bacterium]
MLDFFPQYFTKRAIILYFVSIFACLLIFIGKSMAWYYYLIGGIAVLMFFVGGYTLPIKWARFPPKTLIYNIFTVGLLIRVVWVVFSYYFYSSMNGNPFEFETADAGNYDWLAQQLYEQGWEAYEKIMGKWGFSDRGYPTFLGASYMIYGHNVLIARLIKAVLGAWTAVLVYKLASRTFGESVGRMAGIFCMLMPEMIYWCGIHSKEIEMVFVTTLGVERADNAVRSRKLTFANLVMPMLCAAILFTLRSLLGVGLLFAFITALFFMSARAGTFGNRVLLGVWIIIAIAFIGGGKILTEIEQAWNSRQMQQEESMEWRSKREGGNKFAVYANNAIFAPAIFIIPLPTKVNVASQRNLQLAHGGYFVKNVMAFFVMFALFLIVYDAIKKGNKWRDFLLVGAFMIGYLGVIATISGFAQSGRFHLPIMPFFIMFAAYGINQSTNKVKDYYNFYLVLLFVAFIIWQWYKLAGRDML